ncbi:MAG: hypothetical protein IMZ65_02105 [Planctomycetes bacterium]|nr:hypothetical protein [Planctomycetota bacterium]
MMDSREADTKASDAVFGAEGYAVATKDTDVAPAQRPWPPIRTLMAGGIVVGSLFLTRPTADLQCEQTPQGNMLDLSSVQNSRRSRLEDLAATAVRRMNPEQRALYEDILAIRNSFPEPVDVIGLLRELREDLA